jgi:uncharacterized protein YehS (DUF1456 family)
MLALNGRDVAAALQAVWPEVRCCGLTGAIPWAIPRNPCLVPAMINNDVLRAIRYMLDLGDIKVVEIVHLADPAFPIDKADVQAFLKKDDEEGYAECSNRVLAHFLDGLVIHCRGRDESRPPRPPEKRVTNNVVLKKLRVAFELRDVDMHQILGEAGFPVSKPELNALFRQPEHKNFRLCGDQLLRHFLRGLTMRLRGSD